MAAEKQTIEINSIEVVFEEKSPVEVGVLVLDFFIQENSVINDDQSHAATGIPAT